MDTRILPAASPDALPAALEILERGGLVAFPTDTVYGVGALAFDGEAVLSIYAAKDRPAEKSIPVLIGEVEDLAKVALSIPEMASRLAARFWPGPLTLVVPRLAELPEAVSATSTVGVRIPDHPAARALLRRSGPLAVTSANISGQLAPTSAEEVMAQLGGRIALILDGGQTPGGLASSVVDCTAAEPVLLRPGPITLAQIQAALVG